MNWYKTALPVVDTPSDMHYTDIGHRLYDKDIKEILWTVDENFNFRSIQKTKKDTGTIHEELFGFSFDYRSAGSIASGRFMGDSSGGRTSITINLDPDKTNPKRIEYILKRVRKILDKEFNNPEIYEFN